jgi:hypothetical protein
MIKDWGLDEHTYLRDKVPQMGLKTPFRDGTVQDIAKQVMNPYIHLIHSELILMPASSLHRALFDVTARSVEAYPPAVTAQVSVCC